MKRVWTVCFISFQFGARWAVCPGAAGCCSPASERAGWCSPTCRSASCTPCAGPGDLPQMIESPVSPVSLGLQEMGVVSHSSHAMCGSGIGGCGCSAPCGGATPQSSSIGRGVWGAMQQQMNKTRNRKPSLGCLSPGATHWAPEVLPTLFYVALELPAALTTAMMLSIDLITSRGLN